MCSLLLATFLAAGAPCPAPVATAAPRSTRALADRELSRIRGAQAVRFTSGRGGLARITQDSGMRELTLVRSVAVQQFDNWFIDVAEPMVAANLSR